VLVDVNMVQAELAVVAVVATVVEGEEMAQLFEDLKAAGGQPSAPYISR
jgi:hypothetical protein